MDSSLGPGELDPNVQTIGMVIGTKGSGKSKYLRYVAASYPYDQVIIDLHGVDEPAETGIKDSGVVRIDEVPTRWPEHLRPKPETPLILYYQPDVGSPTLLEDMDAGSALAYTHGRTLLLVHEWGALGHVHKTPPATRRCLSQGRKRKVTMLLAMHRPVDIDRMTWVQADWVALFDVPVQDDQDIISKNIGWDTQDFRLAIQGALAEDERREPYDYLLFDRRIPRPRPGEQDDRLLAFPALTEEELRGVMHAHRDRTHTQAL